MSRLFTTSSRVRWCVATPCDGRWTHSRRPEQPACPPRSPGSRPKRQHAGATTRASGASAESAAADRRSERLQISREVTDLGARQRRRAAVLSPPPQVADANRSASVAAQPLCMNGARQETPRSDGIWNGRAGADVDGRVVRQQRTGVTGRAPDLGIRRTPPCRARRRPRPGRPWRASPGWCRSSPAAPSSDWCPAGARPFAPRTRRPSGPRSHARLRPSGTAPCR